MIKLRSTKKGFTLLELLAVMAIMMIMATIAITAYKYLVTGVGISGSLAHLTQSLKLARQQAIMQGKNAYVVFYQDTNSVPAKSWYVTCLGQGTKTHGGGGDRLIDAYNGDMEHLVSGVILFNLSSDKASFSDITTVRPSGTPTGAFEIVTSDGIWAVDDRYGWEVSQKSYLPRGFLFVEDPPSTIRFKPNGTAVKVDGNRAAGGHVVKMYEEIRPASEFGVKVEFDGGVNVVY